MSKELKNPLIQVSEKTIKNLLNLTAYELGLRIKKHGDKSFASNAEGRGIIDEERDELCEAIHSEINPNVVHEAIDVAVAALWLVATRIEKDHLPVCSCGHMHYCAESENCECPGIKEESAK
jgi:hypothetical protein